MGNERIPRLRGFGSSVKRMMSSRIYIIQVVTVLFLACISLFVLKEVDRLSATMPAEMIDSFKVGNTYNIGALSVKNLDAYKNEFFDSLLTGALSGSFLQGLIGWVVAVFVAGELKKGYYTTLLVRGHNRISLYYKYIGASVVIILPIIAVYVLGIFLSVAFAGGGKQLEDAARVLGCGLLQVFMLSALAVISAVITLLIGNLKALIAVEAIIFVLPMAPGYLSVFTNGKIDVSGYSIISRLINISVNRGTEPGMDILVSIVTMAILVIPGMMLIKNRNYK